MGGGRSSVYPLPPKTFENDRQKLVQSMWFTWNPHLLKSRN